jgi:hypothetical protein
MISAPSRILDWLRAAPIRDEVRDRQGDLPDALEIDRLVEAVAAAS